MAFNEDKGFYMSKIVCSECGWQSKGHGMDAEVEFDEHVYDVHMEHDEPEYDVQDSQNNISISVPSSPEHTYGIYIQGGLIKSCGRARILEHRDLLDAGSKNIYDEEEAIELATRVALRLGLKRIYLTKYPNKLVRMITVKESEQE